MLAGLCWGIGEPCTKSVLHTHRIGPVTAIALRSTIALPVLWLAWRVAVRGPGAEPRAGLRLLAAGVLLTGDRKGPAPDPLARAPSPDHHAR